jgi:dTDP-4-amino-4,6-dideoxygalactose transaminase
MTETPHLDRGFRPEDVPPLHPFQARLGRSQLARVDEFIERRRRVGRWLDEELRDVSQVRLLKSVDQGAWNGLYYGILAERAGELASFLFHKGIDCETSEYRNCAELELYRDCRGDCPVAREVESRIVRLPNYPAMIVHDVRRIGAAVRAFYAG